jgi:hypothetical protein
MWPTMFQRWLTQLDGAETGVTIREREIAPALLATLSQAGLLEYAGLDGYSDCRDCALGVGCPIERFGGTDEEPEYLALCPQGEMLLYREADLRRWLLSALSVARVLADRLGHPQPIEELVPRRLWEVGRLGARVRLYLLCGVKKPDARTVATILAERVKLTRGLVLVPGELPAPGLLPSQAIAVSLGEVLRLEETGVILDRALLDDYAERLAGEKAKPAMLPIAVPSGFAWSQVTIEFVSDEDVRIWTVGEPTVKSFSDLGFANARDGQPTKPWHLLREFAGHEGIYDPSHASSLYPPVKNTHRRGQPQVTAFSAKLGSALSDLAQHLAELFPTIAGRPIAAYDSRRHQYRAVVNLRWEPGYRGRVRRDWDETR